MVTQYVLIQEFMYGGNIGMHYSSLIPENDLTEKDFELLDRAHGALVTDDELSNEDCEALDKLSGKYKVNDPQPPHGGVISRVCQLFYEA